MSKFRDQIKANDAGHAARQIAAERAKVVATIRAELDPESCDCDMCIGGGLSCLLVEAEIDTLVAGLEKRDAEIEGLRGMLWVRPEDIEDAKFDKAHYHKLLIEQGQWSKEIHKSTAELTAVVQNGIKQKMALEQIAELLEELSSHRPTVNFATLEVALTVAKEALK